jgi:hypothetical protein
MDARLVQSARLRQPSSDRQMNRSAHFLVKEHILRKAVDPIICANAPFSNIARTGIGIEYLCKEFTPL